MMKHKSVSVNRRHNTILHSRILPRIHSRCPSDRFAHLSQLNEEQQEDGPCRTRSEMQTVISMNAILNYIMDKGGIITLPTLSWKLIWAPFSSKYLTTERWPLSHAHIRGDHPYYEVVKEYHYNDNTNKTNIRTCICIHMQTGKVHPEREREQRIIMELKWITGSVALTLTPFLKRFLTSSKLSFSNITEENHYWTLWKWVSVSVCVRYACVCARVCVYVCVCVRMCMWLVHAHSHIPYLIFLE